MVVDGQQIDGRVRFRDVVRGGIVAPAGIHAVCWRRRPRLQSSV